MDRRLTLLFISDERDYPLLLKKLGEYHGKFPIFLSMTKNMGVARKEVIDKVVTDYCLCLDMDTDLPEGYIEEALGMLQSNLRLVCVALDYEKSQGHYAFGTSIWKANILKGLYDYRHQTELCECMYLFNKAFRFGYSIDTIGKYRAIHNNKEKS